jgi:hypothetical protein
MNIRKIFLDVTLNQMRRYLHIVHSALTEEQEQFFATVKEITDRLSDDEDPEMVWDHLYDEMVEVRDELPKQLYYSFIVSWYSFIEHELTEICLSRKLTIAVGIRDSDGLGQGIRRARRFLKEAAKYEIPDVYWNEIVKIGWMRNKIVHEAGKLQCSLIPSKSHIPIEIEGNTLYLAIEENQYNYMERHALIEYSAGFVIDPTFEYCIGLVDFAQSFLLKLYNDIL